MVRAGGTFTATRCARVGELSTCSWRQPKRLAPTNCVEATIGVMLLCLPAHDQQRQQLTAMTIKREALIKDIDHVG